MITPSRDSEDRALAAEMNKDSRRLQRTALKSLIWHTEQGIWRSNVVPPRKLPGRTNTARALARLGLADERSIPHHGFKLTERGARVAGLLKAD